MDKKGQTSNMMVGMAIGVILLIVVLSTIFTFLNENALGIQTTSEQETGVNNESLVTLTNADIINSTLVIGNGTTLLTATTEYSVTETQAELGRVQINCFACVNTTTQILNINYSYYPTSYIESGTTRTIVGTLPIILAVLVLLFVVGMGLLKRGES